MPKMHGISCASWKMELQPANLAGSTTPPLKSRRGFPENETRTGLQPYANLACWKGVLRNPDLATVCFG